MSQERELRSRLEVERADLARRESALREIDAEWNALEDKRARYEPLEAACQSLEKLFESDLSRVFWGHRASDDDVRLHLGDVRMAITALAEGQIEVEHRRDSARKAVRAQLDVVDAIDYDLEQLLEAEERRLQEWVVERAESQLAPRAQILPWSRRLEDDQRFRKTLLVSALACLVLGMVVPLVDIPIPEREEITEVPERFARLIREEPLRPMPEPQPVQERRVEEKPEPVEPEVKPEVRETEVAKTAAPDPAPEAPRDRVASAGLLAFRESFSNLASSRPSAKLGAEARISKSGDTAVGLPQRSMVSTSGPGSSGGINLAELSRDVGDGSGAGEAIEGVALSRVASSIGSGGGSDRPMASGAAAGRTDEEIQIVFDRYKAALYRLYNRELRKDPTLRGQMVLKLTIEPDGTVSVCRLQSSDMDAPLLAEQVVDRVRGFDFGAKDVPSITILYPIDFLPTA